MEDPKARMTASISSIELERRWKTVRDVMREEKVDYLIMRQDEEFLGGYVRWFTDIPAQHSYPFTVIFPIHDEMTLITVGGPPPSEPFPPPWAVRGVKQRLSDAYFPSICYTGHYDAELAAGVLKEKKGATVGLIGSTSIPVTFYEYLRKHLDGYKFVELTDRIDQIKGIKSPEEIELIKKTASLQDVVIEHIKRVLQPGMREFEIHAEALYSAMMHGSERQLILVGSGSPGTPAPFQHRRFQNRIIQEGDQVSILIEVNGPGGFYAEIGRIFSVGEPSQLLQDAFGTALEAQKVTLDLLKPDASPKEILSANNAFLQKEGYTPERRLYAHGQGYDLVERPLIRSDEPMSLKAGMNLTVHPAATNATVWVTVCDNYLVTEKGAGECLHQTPKEIIVV